MKRFWSNARVFAGMALFIGPVALLGFIVWCFGGMEDVA